jgi:hypothetical protein
LKAGYIITYLPEPRQIPNEGGRFAGNIKNFTGTEGGQTFQNFPRSGPRRIQDGKIDLLGFRQDFSGCRFRPLGPKITVFQSILGGIFFRGGNRRFIDRSPRSAFAPKGG